MRSVPAVMLPHWSEPPICGESKPRHVGCEVYGGGIEPGEGACCPTRRSRRSVRRNTSKIKSHALRSFRFWRRVWKRCVHEGMMLPHWSEPPVCGENSARSVTCDVCGGGFEWGGRCMLPSCCATCPSLQFAGQQTGRQRKKRMCLPRPFEVGAWSLLGITSHCA